jgi:hypothetical protein
MGAFSFPLISRQLDRIEFLFGGGVASWTTANGKWPAPAVITS